MERKKKRKKKKQEINYWGNIFQFGARLEKGEEKKDCTEETLTHS